MYLIDEAKIYLKAGKGGDGVVSFRREKFIEFGGPNGGNGGKGGDVIIRGVSNLNTLVDFRYKQHFFAKDGRHGEGSDRTGSSGEDMYIDVPIGTGIYSEDGGTWIADIMNANAEIVLAKGGSGGLGNATFKSSTNRAPRKATKGILGDELVIWLKLKLLSNVGLIGLPNAGKSTFLSSVSASKTKIAAYPFTTLKPHLGTVFFADHKFVMADIPGLIEGANEGHGLGDKFLKHIERCQILLHLIDGGLDDPVGAYQVIRNELGKYKGEVLEKFELVALSKSDVIEEKELRMKKKMLERHLGKGVFVCSGVTKHGISAVLDIIVNVLRKFDVECIE